MDGWMGGWVDGWTGGWWVYGRAGLRIAYSNQDMVKHYIKEYDISICCIQEKEIEPDYPVDLLSLLAYNYESDYNTEKCRAGIYNKLSQGKSR